MTTIQPIGCCIGCKAPLKGTLLGAQICVKCFKATIESCCARLSNEIASAIAAARENAAGPVEAGDPLSRPEQLRDMLKQFNFSIPAGATITSVCVNMRLRDGKPYMVNYKPPDEPDEPLSVEKPE